MATDIDHQDPNVLVWVVAQKIKMMALSDDPAWGREIPHNASNGIGNNEDLRMTLSRVLDATASLAVFEAGLQVVAVALNFGDQWRGIGPKLTMAENREVPQSVVDHIMNVWKVLREMSLLAIDNEDRKPFEAQLKEQVYSFCIKKNLKRFKSCILRLDQFKDTLSAVTLAEQNRFPTDVVDFRDVRDLLNKTAPSVDDIKAMILKMDPILGRINAMKTEWAARAAGVANDVWAAEFRKIRDLRIGSNNLTANGLNEGDMRNLQEWIEEVKHSDGPTIIRRTLEKLTSQDRHIRTLINATTNRELRPLFVFEMTVERILKTDDIEVKVPATPETTDTRFPLSYIIRAMYESIKPKITSSLIDKEVAELTATLRKHDVDHPTRKNNGTNKGVVHCECGLVAFLHQNSTNQNATQFNYIGVSKLSCGLCHAWLMAFNATRGQELKYYTGGTHNKWYTNWAIPPSLATTELKDNLSKIICEQFVRYCNPNLGRMERQDLSGSMNHFTA